jgi:hypothetical protein
MQEARDRRRWHRVNIPGGLRASLGSISGLRVLNLSLAGALIELAEPLSTGQRCILDLFLAGVEVHLPGHVAWCAVHSVFSAPGVEGETRYRAGLHFTGLPEGVQAHLRGYLAGWGPPAPEPPQGFE